MKPLRPNFQSLSIKDLLQARDQYHYQLMNKANVAGTAIGLYLIRTSDPYPTAAVKADTAVQKGKEPRTFENSSVREYSWPCVLVMVREWVDAWDFHVDGKVPPEEMVPKSLELPDGRSVPVCVVQVIEGETNDEPVLSQLQWPTHVIGGGYPLLVHSQGEDHFASVGCLVSDGHTTYALTNRHVAGNPGAVIHTLLHGSPVPIGTTSTKQLTRLSFSDVYTEYPSRKTYTNLDVGLIEVDDAKMWTSDITGIGPIGEMQDLNESSLSLDLIDQPVEAFGSASGLLQGKIQALFYRYKTAAGYDYVTDLLIAPADPKASQTRLGDSGTVWLIPGDTPDELPRPLAVEWGAQTYMAGGELNRFHFTLASSLCNICQLLDVQLVQAHNTGASVTWGSTGHYTIGAYACDLLRNTKLKDLMNQNTDRISFDLGESGLDPKDIATKLHDAKVNGEFVPLADVPDIIWKNNPKDVTGGRDTEHGGHGWTGPEHPNHFADVDEPLPEGDPNAGKTMIDLCTTTAQLTADYWLDYYVACGHKQKGQHGLLPFRVWQIYGAMVKSLQEGKVGEFLAAAGILSHYVGDACQPLHSSMYSDGYSDQTSTTTVHKRDGSDAEKTIWNGMGVHGTYEDGMVDKYASDLFAKVKALGDPAALPLIEGGANAGLCVVDLMRKSQQELPPNKIIETYIKAGGKKNNTTYAALFKACGDETAQLWLNGAAVLASLWDSAWSEATEVHIADIDIREYTEKEMQALYQSADFLPSYYLDEIGDKL
jgi:hypothetical protein